jgi:hypothetical protein
MKLLDGLRGSAGDFLDRGDATFSCRFKFNITWEPSDGAGKFFFDQVWLEDFEADTVVDGKSSVWSVGWVVGSPPRSCGACQSGPASVGVGMRGR